MAMFISERKAEKKRYMRSILRFKMCVSDFPFSFHQNTFFLLNPFFSILFWYPSFPPLISASLHLQTSSLLNGFLSFFLSYKFTLNSSSSIIPKYRLPQSYLQYIQAGQT